MKKTRARKSHATVPLTCKCNKSSANCVITFAGKSNWAGQGALKGFYVNCEVTLLKSQHFIFADPSPYKKLLNDVLQPMP